jgi:hypothetical protein
LSDTRLQLIAAVALVKRGVEPPVTVLEDVAASHACRRGTTAEGPRQWCLWKFSDEEGTTFAGVSGPYPLDPSLHSLSDGGDTFSKFTVWEQATPEQHLAFILETLNDWRISLCSTD